MSRKPHPRHTGKSVKIPILGNLEHNAGINAAIGGLVIAWANNESVFMAMLQALVSGGPLTASIIWHSQRTTTARLDLVGRLSREQIADTALLADIDRAIKQFKGYSRVRNFYCHANYEHDETLRLHNAVGTTLTQDGEPLQFERRVLDAGAINEIGNTTINLAEFNRHLWSLIPRIEDALGVRRVKMPPLPPER